MGYTAEIAAMACLQGAARIVHFFGALAHTLFACDGIDVVDAVAQLAAQKAIDFCCHSVEYV